MNSFFNTISNEKNYLLFDPTKIATKNLVKMLILKYSKMQIKFIGNIKDYNNLELNIQKQDKIIIDDIDNKCTFSKFINEVVHKNDPNLLLIVLLPITMTFILTTSFNLIQHKLKSTLIFSSNDIFVMPHIARNTFDHIFIKSYLTMAESRIIYELYFKMVPSYLEVYDIASKTPTDSFMHVFLENSHSMYKTWNIIHNNLLGYVDQINKNNTIKDTDNNFDEEIVIFI